MKLRAPQKKLGELLIEAGLISDEQLGQALTIQKHSKKMLGSVLIGEGMVSGSAMVGVLASQLGLRGVILRHGLIDTSLLKEIGQEEAMRRMAWAAAQSVLDQFDGTLRPDFIFNREHLQAI